MAFFGVGRHRQHRAKVLAEKALQLNAGKKLRCPACAEWFTSDEAYKAHYREKHGPKKL